MHSRPNFKININSASVKKLNTHLDIKLFLTAYYQHAYFLTIEVIFQNGGSTCITYKCKSSL